MPETGISAFGRSLGGALSILIVVSGARAQMSVPASQPPLGEEFCKRRCATCHTVHAGDPKRQGPTLDGVYGRKSGSIAEFHSSPGFAKADWTSDDAHLDAGLTNPQAMIPGAIVPYRQARPEVRAAIIGYSKELKSWPNPFIP